ncbi:hypothetical protein Ssi03_10740 [Sphaerisporangium siamense]|nr:hypothetical protein Ssi03_10740 [Sphaerisporangium siamense]
MSKVQIRAGPLPGAHVRASRSGSSSGSGDMACAQGFVPKITLKGHVQGSRCLVTTTPSASPQKPAIVADHDRHIPPRYPKETGQSHCLPALAPGTAPQSDERRQPQARA